MNKKIYGLLGRKLGHSYSPQIHAAFGLTDYQLIEKEPEEVADFLRDPALGAVNVTIPYKITAFELCDELTQAAQAIGSVNTVVRRDDGTLLGDNTDGNLRGVPFLFQSNTYALCGRLQPLHDRSTQPLQLNVGFLGGNAFFVQT